MIRRLRFVWTHLGKKYVSVKKQQWQSAFKYALVLMTGR